MVPDTLLGPDISGGEKGRLIYRVEICNNDHQPLVISVSKNNTEILTVDDYPAGMQRIVTFPFLVLQPGDVLRVRPCAASWLNTPLCRWFYKEGILNEAEAQAKDAEAKFIAQLQKNIGVTPDGIPGPKTQKALSEDTFAKRLYPTEETTELIARLRSRQIDGPRTREVEEPEPRPTRKIRLK